MPMSPRVCNADDALAARVCMVTAFHEHFRVRILTASCADIGMLGRLYADT